MNSSRLTGIGIKLNKIQWGWIT